MRVTATKGYLWVGATPVPAAGFPQPPQMSAPGAMTILQLAQIIFTIYRRIVCHR